MRSSNQLKVRNTNMVEIRPLEQNLGATFVKYLGELDFGHAPHWSACFCRFYHTNCSNEQWQKRTADENREEAIEQIKSGNMKGFLAFDKDQCIGWCNANDARKYDRLENDIADIIKNKKVGCVICFVIHPEHRKQGVARAMLKYAVDNFRAQGFESVLAFPVNFNCTPEMRYRGTMNMYKELGFSELEKSEHSTIMQLML